MSLDTFRTIIVLLNVLFYCFSLSYCFILTIRTLVYKLKILYYIFSLNINLVLFLLTLSLLSYYLLEPHSVARVLLIASPRFNSYCVFGLWFSTLALNPILSFLPRSWQQCSQSTNLTVAPSLTMTPSLPGISVTTDSSARLIHWPFLWTFEGATPVENSE